MPAGPRLSRDKEVPVAATPINPHEISRREFASRLGAATAGLAVAGSVFDSRVLGASDRVVVASIGIRGQGNSLKRGFARLSNVEIKTLCDIDANLAPQRINDARLSDVPSFRPTFAQDLRRVLDDKDIDAVVIATPNHWHALATIWALQAGKHVYVEKPASHTVWEGRKMVEAAARYKKLVQVGTMNRSRPAVRDAIKFLHDGVREKALSLCSDPVAFYILYGRDIDVQQGVLWHALFQDEPRESGGKRRCLPEIKVASGCQ